MPSIWHNSKCRHKTEDRPCGRHGSCRSSVRFGNQVSISAHEYGAQTPSQDWRHGITNSRHSNTLIISHFLNAFSPHAPQPPSCARCCQGCRRGCYRIGAWRRRRATERRPVVHPAPGQASRRDHGPLRCNNVRHPVGHRLLVSALSPSSPVMTPLNSSDSCIARHANSMPPLSSFIASTNPSLSLPIPTTFSTMSAARQASWSLRFSLGTLSSSPLALSLPWVPSSWPHSWLCTSRPPFWGMPSTTRWGLGWGRRQWRVGRSRRSTSR